MATSDARSPVREPLLQQPPPVNEHAQPSEQPPSQLVQPESAAPLPSQTGTLKVLALVLLAVAILDQKWHAVQQAGGFVKQDLPAELPASRWKQVTSTDRISNSMIMFGVFNMAKLSGRSYGVPALMDVRLWLFSIANSAMFVQGSQPDKRGEAPDPRRAAAGALFTIPNSASKQLLIHGGRLEAGHILEDLWQATLGTGNVTYQQLWPPLRDSVDNKKHPRGPAARKGHSAIAIQENDPCMVVFGGRNGIGYFNDVWAFRLSTGVWEEWTPTDGNAASPMGRDHFGAVYDAGHMYIFGGRGGSSYGKSQPLGDLWRFTIASRTWTELNATGSTPMARFLFSSDLFYPSAAPSQGDNGPAGFMVIFGGETVNECYLNDVWVLHLNSLRWKQLSKPVACQKRCRSIVEARS
ncbi:hypothetical protein WJX79_003782 [Trebouxia sp. C0005]